MGLAETLTGTLFEAHAGVIVAVFIMHTLYIRLECSVIKLANNE